MQDFVAALGLVLVIEGLLYLLFPHRLKEWMQMAQSLPETTLRNGGLASIAIGLFVVWIARSLLSG